MLSISKQYSISDRMIDECATVGGMRISRSNKVLGENPTQCYTF
jgi:hypothetical protein